MFDPSNFDTMSVDGANDTVVATIEPGEYQAFVTKIAPKVVGEDNKPLIEVFWKIDAPLNEVAHERTVKQTVWLDLNTAGGIDTGKGKNAQLGKLREAVNQNTGAWNPGMLEGARATINVVPDGEYTAVKGVAAAA